MPSAEELKEGMILQTRWGSLKGGLPDTILLLHSIKDTSIPKWLCLSVWQGKVEIEEWSTVMLTQDRFKVISDAGS
jgi:tellurite resistance-related uncharacterized protein